jgi:hypothetical protein
MGNKIRFQGRSLLRGLADESIKSSPSCACSDLLVILLPPDQPEALTYDHMHLAFPDTKASTAWYINIWVQRRGPTAWTASSSDRIRFNMRQTGKPEAEQRSPVVGCRSLCVFPILMHR